MRPYVVIIEDDRISMEIAAKVVQSLGFGVVRFLDSDKAAKFLQRHNEDTPIHAVVSDVLMPYKDGISVFQEMSENETLKNLPFIFLSGADKAVVEAGLEKFGAYQFLAKPLDQSALEEALGRCR